MKNTNEKQIKIINVNESRKQPKVAYFCMEFGLSEEFEIYSGGLGILAGDIMNRWPPKTPPANGRRSQTQDSWQKDSCS